MTKSIDLVIPFLCSIKKQKFLNVIFRIIKTHDDTLKLSKILGEYFMKRKIILLGLLLAIMGTAGCAQSNQDAKSAAESARDSIDDGKLSIDGKTFQAKKKTNMQATIPIQSKPGATVTAWDAEVPSITYTGNQGKKLNQNGNAKIKVEAEYDEVTIKIKVAYGNHFKTATVTVKPAKTEKERAADMSKKSAESEQNEKAKAESKAAKAAEESKSKAEEKARAESESKAKEESTRQAQASSRAAEESAKIAAESSRRAAEASSRANEVPTEYQSALTKAQDYNKLFHMSRAGLYDQLTSDAGEKFSPAAANYALTHLQVDYNYNALETAKLYQTEMSMSPESIREQLTSTAGEKFTQAEANYAIANLPR
ncbi:Ltp family lipoprotein [Lacticaseibacillus saniviri]